MGNIKWIVVIFVACLSLTSCFDVVEEIDLKSNGTGKIKATLNMSKSKTKAASLMKLDKIEGMKVPSAAEIRKEMNTVVSLLKQTPGISNVQHSLDLTEFIATISCDFKDVSALNNFSKTLSKHFKVDVSGSSSYAYNNAAKTFDRKYIHNSDSKKEFDKLTPESQKSFNDAFFTSIYRFQDDVKSVSNPQAKISPNKKAVMMRVSVPTLVKGTINLSNKITLR